MLRVIEVYVRQTDMVNAAVRYTVQESSSGEWKEREHVDVNAGTVGARRKFLLETHERLIVEDLAEVVVGWDNDQMATKRVFVGKELPQPPLETEYSTQMEGTDADL